MDSKSDKQNKANWNGIKIYLSQEEYDIAMSHVEKTRHFFEENNIYNKLDEDDDDYADPSEWKLSDTLNYAFEEARRKAGNKKVSDSELLSLGLKIISEEIRFSDPCTDDDADDVF